MFQNRIFKVLSSLILLALIFSAIDVTPAHAAGIRYATPDGTGDCSSWENACALQTALTGAVSSDEVWVAAGTYKPTSDIDRTITFTLKNGVAVYGGFIGTETLRSQRDPAVNLTILSGDIGISGNTSDNSYHVLTTNSGTNITAVLDGFTVTAGNAVNSNNKGGGMYNYQGSPTLANITFSGNSATDGGGMYNYQSSPTLANITFSGNTSGWSGGGMLNYQSSPTLTNVTFSGNSSFNGGGMGNYTSSSPTLTNVTFSNNTAGQIGGGMTNCNGCNPVLTNVTFSGNSARDGGGMSNEYNSPTLTNVTFSGNTASRIGGGILNDHGSPTLINVTFSGNSAPTGGGMSNEYSSNPTIRNTIFWGNSSEIYHYSSASTITDSIVAGGCPSGSACTNVINADPRLGTLGNYGGLTLTLPLLAGSSAIDAGNNATCASTDQRSVSRPQAAQCDIGAYEADSVYFGISGNTGVGGVTLSYFDGVPRNITANGNGDYTIAVSNGWSGTVTPSKTGYNFTPASKSYTNIIADQFAQNYTAALITYTITGNVGVANAAITYTGGSTTANGSGAYSITVSYGWSGTVTPSKAGYTFSAAKSYSNVTANKSGEDYTFTQNEYTLNVVSDHGTVTKLPEQPTYYYGDEVTLSMATAPGWTFTGWTPSLTDNKVTINSNTAVTANFTQNEYTLAITSAHGTVAKNPEQATYHEGDVVQLTATPTTDWTFANWTGDLTGSVNPDTVTIHGNTSVTANYTFDNQSPTDIALSNSTVTENLPAGTTVGTLTTTDPDAGDTHTYSFACTVPGADDASFQIGGVGNDELQTAAVFDYETKNAYDICLRTDDGHGGTFDKAFTINVIDTNETLTTTFRSAGTNDGWILESTETSGVGGTLDKTATVFNLGDGTADKQYRSILSFNTINLPENAVITKVTLKIRVSGALVGNNSPFTWGNGLKVDVCKGVFGTTSALQLTDFNFNNATNCKLLAGTFGNTPTSGWYSVNLISTAWSKINTAGLTQFRLRFAKDDNDDGAADYWRFFSGNTTTASARPTLIIEYYVP